jgi:D-serine deaminase-like pyridoxal phosphate-dependent protein
MTLPAGIETPAVLVDLDIAEANIRAAQAHFDAVGVKLRPHIKTHKLIALARTQLAAGAVGITCQKVGEAEVFVRAGFDDVLITYNVLGVEKLARLRELSLRARIAVCADSATTINGLSTAFAAAPKPLSVLVECDTGGGRCGVQSPETAAELAGLIARSPGLIFGGLMTYPAPGTHARVDDFMTVARDRSIQAAGSCATITSGGTPSMRAFKHSTVVTEYRPGTYVYNDRSLVARGVARVEDCALRVAATVVSRPTADRAVLDSGSKTLSSDLLGLTGYGLLPDFPGAMIVGLSEEHAVVDLSGAGARPDVGEIVSVIPNHACVVTNLTDRVFLHRGPGAPVATAVDARGRVW